MTAGALLRTTRRRHGLTQRQLAIRARTSQAAISRIERDLVSPAVATLAELLRLMNEELVLEARESRRTLGPPVTHGELDPAPTLRMLEQHAVDFVVGGGLAGMAHGSRYPTDDMDVAYDRSRENLGRLASALRELEATPRGGRPGLSFALDSIRLANGSNFTFDTQFGPLHIHGDPAGAPRYGSLREQATEAAIFGVRVRVASLDHLIAMREAAGRPRDLLAASEYRVISDELRRPQPDAGL